MPDKNNFEEKKKLYDYLKEWGIDTKKDKEILKEEEEYKAKENMKKILKNHEEAKKKQGIEKQKVLKGENTNIINKKRKLDRKQLVLNYLKDIYN